MADEILFLTELVGLRVFDLRGRRIGVVKDAALVPLVNPVRVDRFLIGGDAAWFTVRHDQIRSISLDGIHLQDETLTPYHSDEYMLRLQRDLLDQQIIDSEGRKVVRVTDLTFVIKDESGGQVLYVDDVDIGLRSIFRRLVQGVLPRRLIRRLQEPIPPRSIRWAVCNILEHDPQRRLRLNISNKLLEQMHPADLADIVEELGPEDRQAIFENMDREAAAEALAEVDPDIQASILESLEAEMAAEIVEEMSPDQAADVLADLDERASEEILEEMEHEGQEEVRELLEFEEDTAGGLMNTEYVALQRTATVADAIDALRAMEDVAETINTIFLVDAEDHLEASIPVGRLFLHKSEAPLEKLIAENKIAVPVDEPQDRVVELFEARKPRDPAQIAEINGIVRFGEITKTSRKIYVTGDDGQEREYAIPRGAHINVQEGERVEAGDQLMDGPIDPHDILKVRGEKELQKYLVNEVQEVYRLQGVNINDKHLEVIVRQMLRWLKIEDIGDTDFLPEEVVDRFKFKEENEKANDKGGRRSHARPILLGITKASLSTDSFISAASFQETTRVLTEAAINSKRDGLRGLKENVIVGRLIPAGSGLAYHMARRNKEADSAEAVFESAPAADTATTEVADA